MKRKVYTWVGVLLKRYRPNRQSLISLLTICAMVSVWPLIANFYYWAFEVSHAKDFNLGYFKYIESKGCVLSEGDRFPQLLNLSPVECEYVRYNGEGVVKLSVNYPDMKVVFDRGIDDSLVVLHLLYVGRSRFSLVRIFKVNQKLAMSDKVAAYTVGGKYLRGFVGVNAGSIVVADWRHTLNKNHTFNPEMEVNYQYSITHTDAKKIDDFAKEFLRKIMPE